MTDSQAHLTVEELAKHWRVSNKLIRKLIRSGSLKAHRMGRLMRVSPEEAERYEREQRV